MSPREIKIVDRIRKKLEARGAEVIKTYGSAFRKGDPDLLVSYPIPGTDLAAFVAIEVKLPGKEPEPIQEARLRKLANSGAIAFWADTSDGIEDVIEDEIRARMNT